MIVAALLWAQAGGGVDPLSAFATYGPLGLMVVGFLSGAIVPGTMYRKAEAENERLRKLIEDRVLPLVENSSRVTEAAMDVLREQDRPPRRRP